MTVRGTNNEIKEYWDIVKYIIRDITEPQANRKVIIFNPLSTF